MDLSIVIVNYKSQDKVLRCLGSLKNADLGDLAHEIIVVDNASGDDLSAVSAAYPDVKIIYSKKNLGMGGGNNLGIKNSHGDSILILNPDTLIHKDSILHLHRHLHANEKTGIVGPKLLNTDGTLQYSCLRFPKLYTPILRRTFFGGLIPKHLNEFLMKDYDHENSREVDWLMGSCLLVKRKMLEVLDCLFDEKFFMYFEDTDLCRRAKKAGWKVVYHPQAVVIHDHARASASYPWYIAPFVDTLAREHIKSWLKYFFR